LSYPGYARTWIVFPSTIWGLADTVFVKQGLQKANSIQIPAIIQFTIRLGKATYVGEGKNVWPHVHIDEGAEVVSFDAVWSRLTYFEMRQVAKFYYILFDAIVSGKQPASGRNGYYFLESGEYNQLAAVEAIAKALYAHGKVSSPAPTQLSEADVGPELYQRALSGVGTNSRARGERSRQLGWNPPQTTEDFYAGIPADVDYLLKTKLRSSV
jgi:hypothetical protein